MLFSEGDMLRVNPVMTQCPDIWDDRRLCFWASDYVGLIPNIGAQVPCNSYRRSENDMIRSNVSRYC
jgi:hypothetical protein